MLAYLGILVIPEDHIGEESGNINAKPANEDKFNLIKSCHEESLPRPLLDAFQTFRKCFG